MVRKSFSFRRLLFFTGAFILVALVLSLILFRFGFPRLLGLGQPHTFSTPQAQIHPELMDQMVKHSSYGDVEDLDDLITFTMQRTSENLYPDLYHSYSLHFRELRAAHCLEYSHFFGSAFNSFAGAKGIPFRAIVVRSEEATFAGQRIPLSGFENHDWIMIIPAGSESTGQIAISRGLRFLDPMFYDLFYIADIEASIH